MDLANSQSMLYYKHINTTIPQPNIRSTAKQLINAVSQFPQMCRNITERERDNERERERVVAHLLTEAQGTRQRLNVAFEKEKNARHLVATAVIMTQS